jgi:acetate kinase
LTVNTGSSSLKIEAFDLTRALASVFKASVKNIGLEHATLCVESADKVDSRQEAPAEVSRHGEALEHVLAAFQQRFELDQLKCIAHRVVHGGTRFKQASRLDAAALRALRQLVELAPDHMPQALAAIDFFQERFPSLVQIAAFDTTFHLTMPACAANFGLPPQYALQGLKRFGFHGLSYSYIVQRLAALEPSQRHSRLIVAHLGSGASIAAIRDGTSIDTSMGFSPDSGLVMASRAGDIDAAAVLYLIRHKGMSVDDIDQLLNKKSGLEGMAGHAGNMQEVLRVQQTEVKARAAIEMFCYRIKRYLGSYAAALGGLDTLVFTGGIGENSAEIRGRICADLEFLGIALDSEANEAGQDVISTPSSSVKIRIIATDEDLVIAQQAAALVTSD